ncbi:ABC transporter ATP-binding protein [Haematobacter missouriensis]|uniref:ABC transporter ATP-binding protein n=1 Tax=Haematobacter missouriensis TaxID=366616 RepID=A0A212AMS2_9RHOB|nr:ATP-binding cassette domain-containing protein [Haematobacter missouriensis]KFI32367.1 ABC transporter ATP-binding protein [Haematobacter missouriensis]OWJ71107.1 ABC transporter ATP-binding protein [Haematobacter missouriensis]OWJ82808.1 ABC transporter ATP-binding protein [Haematobacter missouriensis]
MRRMRKDFAPVVRALAEGREGRLLLGAGLAAITALAGVALLGLSGWFITATALAGLSMATALSFGVLMPAAGIRLLAVLRTVARYGERLVTHGATLGALAELRVRLFRGWSPSEAAGALATRPSRLLFRISADSEALDSLYLRVAVPLAAAGLAALGVGLALAVVSPVLGLGAFIVLTAAVAIIPLLSLRAGSSAIYARSRWLEGLRGHVITLVRNQADYAMAGRLPAECERIAALDGALARADDRANRVEVAAGAGATVVSAVLIAAVTLVVAGMVSENRIGVAVAAFGILLAVAAGDPLAALRRVGAEAARARLAARRLGPRLVMLPSPAPLPLPPEGQAVVLRHVSAGPVARGETLHDITLSLRRGEKVAVIGPSGAGKSTLLLLLAGEVRARRGEVAVLPSTLLTQRSELFQDSLADNLRLADPCADDAALIRGLEDAGLPRFTARLAFPLGEGGIGLSGGEARRLALATLFLRPAPLWLLDEPTEGIDATTARDIAQRLDLRRSGHTMVIVTHVRREAEGADLLITMEQGRIACLHRQGEASYTAALSALRPD